MKYACVNGQSLSAMTLGTVQLGMNYGIANNSGQPKLEQSMAMLKAAMDGGITSVDTARDYGESEDVLGQFFKSYTGELPFITTKLPTITGDTDAEIERDVVTKAETSLEKLNVKKVGCVMLHTVGDLRKNAGKIAAAMNSLIKRGYTDSVGASIYTGEDIEEMLKYDYTATQIPMSIFDRRLIKSGMVNKLCERGYTIFVRSVFLQGLFFLDPDKITDPILKEHAEGRIRTIRSLAEREKMTVAELAITYIRDIPGVTSLVLGADTPEQIRSNIGCFEKQPLSDETIADIEREFDNVDIPEIMKVLSRPKS